MYAMGSDVGRAYFGEDCWTKALEQDIRDGGGFSPEWPVVVDDLHFNHEAQWIRDMGGMVWQVTNPRPARRLVTTTTPPASPDLVDHVIVVTADSQDLLKQVRRILNPAAAAATDRKEVAA